MQRNHHSPEFIEQALLKARTRGTRTLESVAAELNMSLGTLKGWLKRSRHTGPASLPADMPALQWTPAQRLLALHESHALQGPALHAWLELTRFRGHIILCVQGVANVQSTTAIPGGIPTADG
jgi:hypothetical protein